MANMSGIADLVAEIKSASRNIEQGEAKTNRRLDGIESSVNEPGAEPQIVDLRSKQRDAA